MNRVSGLPSSQPIDLKQYSVRELIFTIFDGDDIPDLSEDTWRFTVFSNIDGSIYFDVNSNDDSADFDLIYTENPEKMAVVIKENLTLVEEELRNHQYELFNVSKNQMFANAEIRVHKTFGGPL